MNHEYYAHICHTDGVYMIVRRLGGGVVRVIGRYPTSRKLWADWWRYHSL